MRCRRSKRVDRRSDATVAACRTLGSRVEVDLGGRVVRGIASDLDLTGALVLDTVDGPVTVTSGEVVRARPVVSS